MRPRVPDGACLCLPELGRVCVWCAGKSENPPETIEEADALGFDSNWKETRSRLEGCPWNPDDLPEHLRGKGYRGADQDGYDGSEWVTPIEHHAGDLIEAARICLEAEII